MLLVRAHRIPRDRLGRPRALEGLALVLRVGAYRCLAAGLFLLWLGFYLMTLPATYTGGTVGWVALPYLTPPLAAFAVVLALLLSLVTTVTVYSVRTALRQRAVGVGVGAVVASLLPASLCCTPLRSDRGWRRFARALFLHLFPPGLGSPPCRSRTHRPPLPLTRGGTVTARELKNRTGERRRRLSGETAHDHRARMRVAQVVPVSTTPCGENPQEIGRER